MNSPLAPQGQSPTSGREAAVASRSAQVQHQVVIHLYRRMQPRRVYPVRVELVPVRGAAAALASVMVRPFVPGAQVTPSEREVHSTAGGQATFYITPLAKGRLHDARLEVRRDGRLLQSIPLNLKTTTQTLTWILLALTFLGPMLLLCATRSTDLSSGGPHPRGPLHQGIMDNVPNVRHVTGTLAGLVQGTYDLAHVLAGDHLSFYLGLVLLGITAISWITHRSQRAWRRGPPLELVVAGMPDQTAETVQIVVPKESSTVKPG